MLLTFCFLILFLSTVRLKAHGFKVGSIGYFSSAIFCLLAFFGLSIWNLVRDAAGQGLLNNVALSEHQIRSLQLILISVALGSFLGNLTLEPFSSLSQTTRIFGSISGSSRFVATFALIVVFIGYLAEGTSIFLRDTYLGSNGIPALSRVSGAFLLPTLCLAVLTMFNQSTGSVRMMSYAVTLIGFTLLLGKGSRASIVLFLFFLLSFFTSRFSAKSKILLGLLAPLFLFLILGNVIEARVSTHGIFMIPRNTIDFFGTASLSNAFKLGLAYAFSWVIVVPLSLGTVTGERIIQNLNPLLNSGVNPFDFGSGGTERLYPYRWVPLSSAGQIYEVIGFIGVCLLFYVLTILVQGSLLSKGRYKDFSFPQLLILGLYFFQFPIFLQYSSRNWFRVLWIIFFLVIFVRVSQSKKHLKAREVNYA